MKKMLMIALSAALLAGATAVVAQDIDLVMEDVELVSSGGSFRVNPTIVVTSVGPLPLIDTTIDVYIDGSLVEQIPYLIQPFESGTCPLTVYPNCDGTCNDLVLGSVTYFGSCYDELVTSTPLVYRCACRWATDAEGVIWHAFTGQQNITVSIDMGLIIPEYDETNNTLTLELGPIPIGDATWSLVKSLYR